VPGDVGDGLGDDPVGGDLDRRGQRRQRVPRPRASPVPRRRAASRAARPAGRARPGRAGLPRHRAVALAGRTTLCVGDAAVGRGDGGAGAAAAGAGAARGPGLACGRRVTGGAHTAMGSVRAIGAAVVSRRPISPPATPDPPQPRKDEEGWRADHEPSRCRWQAGEEVRWILISSSSPIRAAQTKIRLCSNGCYGACRKFAWQPRFGPPSHATRCEFTSQRPARPCTVDYRSWVAKFCDRLYGSESSTTGDARLACGGHHDHQRGRPGREAGQPETRRTFGERSWPRHSSGHQPGWEAVVARNAGFVRQHPRLDHGLPAPASASHRTRCPGPAPWRVRVSLRRTVKGAAAGGAPSLDRGYPSVTFPLVRASFTVPQKCI
jgi:hypothetical protein